MTTKNKEKMISFPVSVFETAETKDDLEDWLMCQDPEFINLLLEARQDDLDGKGIDLETLKKELCIK
jgi:hypothetical protein